MTQQRVDIPGQRDWTRDPGRRPLTLAWDFDPASLHAGHWPDESMSRLFGVLVDVAGGELAVGGVRRDDDGQVVAAVFLVDGNAEARATTLPVAVEALRQQLLILAERGVRIATPAELLGSAAFGRRRLDVPQPQPEPEPEPDAGVLAALDVPTPVEDWYALCDAWGVPRAPEALVRAVQAATWDRATLRYLADQRAKLRPKREGDA